MDTKFERFEKAQFLTARHYSNSQNSIVSFDYSWFLAKNLSNFVSLSWKLHNQYWHNVKWKSLSTWQNEIVTVCNFSPWGFLTHLYAKYVLMITLAKFQALLGSHSLAVNYCFSIQLMSNMHSVKKIKMKGQYWIQIN